MRIFFLVLIIVLAVMIAIRFFVLYCNKSGNVKNEGIVQLVGLISALIIGGLALLFLLGSSGVPWATEFASDVFFWIIGMVICYVISLCILVPIVFFIAPAFLIPYGIKKKKKGLVIVSAVVWGTIYLSILVYFSIYPHEHPYVDLWVYGKTPAEIEEKYGEPAYFENNTIYYRCNWTDWSGFKYYCIEFDESGKVHKIYEDYYDKTWIIGRSYDEVTERFREVWPGIFDAPTEIYTDYEIEFDDKDIAVEFGTGKVP